MNLHGMSVIEIAGLVRRGEASPVEVVAAVLDLVERFDEPLNACCDVRPDVAHAQAEALAQRMRNGDDPGLLAGVPIGVKDLEHAAGFRTTYGDPVHRDDPPAERDSVEVARLRAAGCVVVAKTNTPAHGFHGETDNLVFGPTRNPWAHSRTAGGSSGGSGAAVAIGMLPLATGSDGGGSIRIPSATCGISGFKTTNGVVPSGDDEPPTWGPLSTRGPMARTFEEIAFALDVVKGVSTRDLNSLELPGSFVEAAARPQLDGVRIAWCAKPGLVEPEPRVVDMCERGLRDLEAQGATVEPVDDVFPEPPVLPWLRRSGPGTAAKIGIDPEAWEGRFLPEATNLAVAARDYGMRDMLAGDDGAHRAGLALAAVFERFDVVATPAMGGAPPRVGEPHPLGPGWSGDFTLPFNVTRSPAAVVTVGTLDDDGEELPIALQFAGPRLADLSLMSVVTAVESVFAASERRPPQIPPQI